MKVVIDGVSYVPEVVEKDDITIGSLVRLRVPIEKYPTGYGIVRAFSALFVGVEFLNWDGHNLDGAISNSKGWWLIPDQLELVEKAS